MNDLNTQPIMEYIYRITDITQSPCSETLRTRIPFQIVRYKPKGHRSLGRSFRRWHETNRPLCLRRGRLMMMYTFCLLSSCLRLSLYKYNYSPLFRQTDRQTDTHIHTHTHTDWALLSVTSAWWKHIHTYKHFKFGTHCLSLTFLRRLV
jgi:hypothetical protein